MVNSDVDGCWSWADMLLSLTDLGDSRIFRCCESLRGEKNKRRRLIVVGRWRRVAIVVADADPCHRRCYDAIFRALGRNRPRRSGICDEDVVRDEQIVIQVCPIQSSTRVLFRPVEAGFPALASGCACKKGVARGSTR